eukprot:212107-Pleurochrysis_carterae.AAC.4
MRPWRYIMSRAVPPDAERDCGVKIDLVSKFRLSVPMPELAAAALLCHSLFSSHSSSLAAKHNDHREVLNLASNATLLVENHLSTNDS